MGKRSRVLLAILFVSVLGGAAWYFSPSYEPVYQGRKISTWANELPGPEVFDAGSVSWQTDTRNLTEKERAAQQAILHLNTNTLPFLLRTLRSKETGFTEFLRYNLERHANVYVPIMSGSERKRWNAARAVYTLGPSARSTVPELYELLTNNIEGYPLDVSRNAAYALAGMGSEGVSALIIGTNDPGIRLDTTWALGEVPNPEPSITATLINRLKDPDIAVRMAAAWALGQHPQNHTSAAPPLALLVMDPDPQLRKFVTDALNAQGLTNLSPVSLQENLTHPSLHIRMAATNALLKIDPEAAAQLGVK